MRLWIILALLQFGCVGNNSMGYERFPKPDTRMKGATFQLVPENPANPRWSSVFAANAALAATQRWHAPIGWTRNYNVRIDPKNEGYVLPSGIDFIPTIFGDVGVFFGSEATQANVDLAVQNATTGELITFTEPNHPDQSNMTPARCAQLWPMLRGSGLRLTSPVIALVTTDPLFGTAGTWIDQFVAAVGSADWDVTAIDMYADKTGFDIKTNIAAIAAQLDAAHAKYGKPVWLNETGMISFNSLPSNPTNDQVSAYMMAMIEMCRSRPWVERYCWYRIGPGDGVASQYFQVGLYDQHGKLTEIGRRYSEMW